jgi:opine dehydrogenase
LGESFLFYYNGLSELTIKLLEQVEQEIKRVALAYGTSIIPMKNLLDRYYGCKTESLLEAIRSVPNYMHSKSPDKLCHRFLIEDVACTLIPLAELAKKAKVKIPMIDAVVAIASTLLNKKIHNVARPLKKLGLDKMIVGEIKTWMNPVNTITA